MIRTIHRAKYVLAESDLLLANAAVHVSDPGRISRVEPWQGMPADVDAVLVDWGDAVILPGLVNAHTHLELTALHGELTGAPSFTDWLIRLIQRRREWRPEDYLQSAAEGARLSLSCGTTLVGDISSNGLSGKALKDLPLRKVVFEETLGFLPEKVQEAMASLRQRLEPQQPDALLSSGVAPHAPYSVSPDLYRAAAEWRRAQSAPMTTHVAETLQEILFVESGVGEFREFLSSRGLLPAGWSPPGLS